MRAAGVTTAQLICHEDTWTKLHGLIPLLDRKPPPRVQALEGGLVEVTLSGPYIVTLLRTMYGSWLPGEITEQVIAERAYREFAKVIDAVDPEAKPGQPLPPIVLDDKIGQHGDG